jgi:hypothetical protein
MGRSRPRSDDIVGEGIFFISSAIIAQGRDFWLHSSEGLEKHDGAWTYKLVAETHIYGPASFFGSLWVTGSIQAHDETLRTPRGIRFSSQDVSRQAELVFIAECM